MADIAGIDNARGLLATLSGLAQGTRAPLAEALAASRPQPPAGGATAVSPGAPDPAGFSPALPSLVAEPLSFRADTFFAFAEQARATADENRAARAAEAEENEEEEDAAARADRAGPLSSQDFAALLQAGGETTPTSANVAGNFLNAASLL